MHLELRTVRWGLVFSILAILFGFLMGGAFGAAEDSLKGYLKTQGESALGTVYGQDQEKMTEVVTKSWTYFKRAHMHGGGIGATTLALSLLLAGLGGAPLLRAIAAGGMGLGAWGYSLFWLLAGMRAPALGGTDLAKESLNWLAIPSAGLLILGVIFTLVLSIQMLWRKQVSTES